MSAFFLRHPDENDLALFAGGELGLFARWRIERHLDTCASCQRTVSDFFRLHSELSVLAELPEVDWNRLAEGIESQAAAAQQAAAPRGWVWAPPAVWPGAVAAVCMAVAIAVFVVRQPAEAPQGIASSAEAVAEAADGAKAPAPNLARSARSAAPSPEAAQDAPVEEFASPVSLATDIAAPPPPLAPVQEENAGRLAPGAARVEFALPLAAPPSAVEHAADGRIRLHRFDPATGILTITEIHGR